MSDFGLSSGSMLAAPFQVPIYYEVDCNPMTITLKSVTGRLVLAFKTSCNDFCSCDPGRAT
jgi:hypothetical protein